MSFIFGIQFAAKLQFIIIVIASTTNKLGLG